MALSDNLQGWWCPSLDTAGNGTLTLTDLSGNGNHGTLTNMDAATDWVADTDSGGVRALDFNRALSQYVDCGQVIFSGEFTLSAWVSTQSLVIRQMIMAKNDDPHNEGDAFLYVKDNSTAEFVVFSPNARSIAGPFTTGWHLVTGVNVGGLIKIYIDGQLIDSGASGLPANSNDSLWIGARQYAGFNDYFWGRLDNLGVWDRALTSDEVSELYNGGRSLNLLGGASTEDYSAVDHWTNQVFGLGV